MKIYLLVFLSALLPIFSTAQPKVIISELLYDTPLSESGGPDRYNGEFAAIYNYGRDSVDVTGWRLVSDGAGQSFIFPPASIMAPRAKFVVAYRNMNGSFNLEDLYPGLAWKGRDKIFYQRAIIHANDGESLRLYRANGAAQDSLYYEGTSSKSRSPRLEAYNETDISGARCVSLQRCNVRIESCQIVFNPLDYVTNLVVLSNYPTNMLTENGNPVSPYLQFAYDHSGNRTGRFIVLPQLAASASEADEMGMTATMAASTENTIYYTDMIDRSDVIIYPNPTRGSLAVEIRNMLPDVRYQLMVYSMYGVLVFHQDNVGGYTTIDLTRQLQGLYTMRIVSPTSYLEWKILKE